MAAGTIARFGASPVRLQPIVLEEYNKELNGIILGHNELFDEFDDLRDVATGTGGHGERLTTAEEAIDVIEEDVGEIREEVAAIHAQVLTGHVTVSGTLTHTVSMDTPIVYLSATNDYLTVTLPNPTGLLAGQRVEVQSSSGVLGVTIVVTLANGATYEIEALGGSAPWTATINMNGTTPLWAVSLNTAQRYGTLELTGPIAYGIAHYLFASIDTLNVLLTSESDVSVIVLPDVQSIGNRTIHVRVYADGMAYHGHLQIRNHTDGNIVTIEQAVHTVSWYKFCSDTGTNKWRYRAETFIED